MAAKVKAFLISLLSLKSLTDPAPIHCKVNAQTPTSKLQKCHSEPEKSYNHTLVIDVEGALLKSSPLFPYFMLVAFEGGGPLRAFLLLILYPLICFLSGPMALKAMVMVSFCGIREDGFRVGRAVLPKFFLEDVSLEGFEALMRAEKTVAVSGLPKVMVEGFLEEFLEVGFVLGRELKVVGGYYVGVMEDEKNLEEVFEREKMDGDDAVGIGSLDKGLDHHLFLHCKEIHLVTEADKRKYHLLPRHKYPKPLIFHDGRLAFRPTPMATLAMFMWVPFGFILAILRALVAILLPYKMSIPILSLTGMKLIFKTKPNSSPHISSPNHKKQDPNGILYVSNHRTLLDPLYLSACLNKPVTAVTYSLSRLSELIAPIRTVRLTRNREEDRKTMERLLRQGDLFVCPEGTTCREPYLLRFSPLFGELGAEVVPVAMDAHVSMFYGTTASGLKYMDPLFFLMNPSPSYVVELLDRVCEEYGCCGVGRKSRFEMALFVQKEIGRVLGFQCTQLTRKDKYLMLAGNEGVVSVDNNIHQRK
ncbi:probable glycerol-3-phosphate acyltransferase 3 [Magnolia sinica]|uniref:probable glycerol-3-phosphate acyltransferase 3 n=1 Tax=Magnolia sinica TaxID=86752 RepID=UPI00265816DA|nr:probable glycerol-3-phosphate acyltransferase 3 [Magnolia sinica]